MSKFILRKGSKKVHRIEPGDTLCSLIEGFTGKILFSINGNEEVFIGDHKLSEEQIKDILIALQHRGECANYQKSWSPKARFLNDKIRGFAIGDDGATRWEDSDSNKESDHVG